MLGLITNEVTHTIDAPNALGIITNEVTHTIDGPLGLDPPSRSAYWKWFVALSGVAGAALLAYHGYQRTRSASAAIGWGIIGAIFPANLVGAGVATSQGFAKRKTRSYS